MLKNIDNSNLNIFSRRDIKNISEKRRQKIMAYIVIVFVSCVARSSALAGAQRMRMARRRGALCTAATYASLARAAHIARLFIAAWRAGA